MPVKNYKAKFWVKPDDEPGRTAVYWEAEFDAMARATMRQQRKSFVAGMKGIKKVALEKTPGGEDHD